MKRILAVVLPVVMASLLIAAKPVAGDASIEVAAGSQLYLGGTVSYDTTVPRLAGWRYPMVATICFQDVNNDGTIDTNILGPDIVFSSLTHPSESTVLGGYSSIWTLRGGGDAECRADLDAYGWKGGNQSVTVLDSVIFSAEG